MPGQGFILKSVQEISFEPSTDPLTGCFYLIRFPEGWHIILFPEKHFGWMGHPTAWEEYVVPLLLTRWKVKGKSDTANQIKNCPYAFPRGRVTAEKGKRLICHGGDLWDKRGRGTPPMNVSRAIIKNLFGSLLKEEFDEHERVLAFDRDLVCKELNIQEAWKGIE